MSKRKKASTPKSKIRLQTDGFVVVGRMPNNEHYPCLVCREIPDHVHVDLFTPEPRDIPESIAARVPNTLVITYRLCPRCYEAKPDPWKIRLLLLARLKASVENQ